MRPATLSRYQSGGLLISLGAVLVWSGIGPFDRATWWMEVAPVLIGVPFLVATSRRFPLTPLVTSLLAFFALILMVGGHYTYAEVPLGFWFRDLLDLSRNHYDRLGHLTQGFVPALVAREVLHSPAGWLAGVPLGLRRALDLRALRADRVVGRAARRGVGRCVPRNAG
jgi:uncharacterized membrane protein YjdF